MFPRMLSIYHKVNCLSSDYRGLSGDGYWSSPPDTRAAPLCVAADPAADYRWEALACGGPTVASFICELPGKFRSKINFVEDMDILYYD